MHTVTGAGYATVVMTDLVPETPYRWRIDPVGGMRVPGIIYSTRELLPDLAADKSLDQVANVATLPGIVGASYAMPDMHWGYGFPIGGVAATDVDDDGVVSPGGVGFDISCGVRLLASGMHVSDLAPKLGALMDALDTIIPRGMRRGAIWQLRDEREMDEILACGARYAVERGHGEPRDLEYCEDGGALDGADPADISPRARERGQGQVGSLGSGNHFLEVQAVDEIRDEQLARAYGLWQGQACVMIHTGSRGLGHQVCSDHVASMGPAMDRYGIQVPDRQLACAPVTAPEGQAYLRAMAAAANYGRANRQLLGQAARRAFDRAAGGGNLALVYDVSHNLAKLETHDGRRLCVHRKGATLALPGQPVLVPGSMGTFSYVLAGVSGGAAFHSACHGAGRRLSRHQALRYVKAGELRAELAAAGIAVRGTSSRGLAEEAPGAYKDVGMVVEVCERAGLARTVARLRPVGVVKG
jgi:tRNA-splicing ligase RtcB (3'-phosphate/5'-hydroxy nucleic acid ligase)